MGRFPVHLNTYVHNYNKQHPKDNNTMDPNRVIIDLPPETIILPSPGSLWSHRNGNVYEVLHIANEPNEPRYPISIVYRGTNGKVWVRRADDWHRSMTAVPTTTKET
jgi:hypothetical protein